ncbi:MAG: preprotein translocase subunit YajC [Verrucomicrobiae bacterium]|nr:preprotein translocase subunit YajC [Verrucomicrobiae bacterium]
MNFSHFAILAQESAPVAPPTQPQGGLGQMMPMMILMMVIFYFVLIRPQRKQAKELEQKREGIQIGDDVVTIGGIHGRVTNKADRTVTVKVADNTKIKFEKTAINQVFPNNKEKEAVVVEPEEESAEK